MDLNHLIKNIKLSLSLIRGHATAVGHELTHPSLSHLALPEVLQFCSGDCAELPSQSRLLLKCNWNLKCNVRAISKIPIWGCATEQTGKENINYWTGK